MLQVAGRQFDHLPGHPLGADIMLPDPRQEVLERRQRRRGWRSTSGADALVMGRSSTSLLDAIVPS